MQIFHASTNTIAKLSIFGGLFLVVGLLFLIVGIQRSSYVTQAGVAREQPIQFSHQHHVGGIGIDCRYCHTSVETAASAGIPPTKTCMNCHSQIWLSSPYLEPVRDSWKTNKPLQWNRVHDLPDFVYFNHSIHVAKGVGCSTCHGRVDRMPLMWQSASLQMEWCLECHRNPEKFIRPKSEVFTMEWPPNTTESAQTREEARVQNVPEQGMTQAPAKPDWDAKKGWHQDVDGKRLVEEYKILKPNVLTSCSTCHR
ncbi:MAG: cytochrome c3 family protein [Acidobacteria bacterium]|nr:cytochrome c3 family protein [Acidobacteriota bacterium]